MSVLKLENIDYDAISLDDHYFKITTNDDIENLSVSIKKIGLINYPLLVRNKNKYSIVSGFRRVKACAKASINPIMVYVLTSGDRKAIVLKAIAENAYQRPLNIVEQIRSVRLLLDVTQNNVDDEFYSTVSTALNISQNKKYIQKIIKATNVNELTERLLIEERIALPVALNLIDVDTNVLALFLRFFSNVKLSLSKQKEFVQLIKEIARCENTNELTILESVFALMDNDSNDSNQLYSMIRKNLHSRRYPEITKYKATYDSLSKKLGFGDKIKLIPPEGFESMMYTIHISFKSISQLKNATESLNRIIIQQEMKEILDR